MYINASYFEGLKSGKEVSFLFALL